MNNILFIIVDSLSYERLYNRGNNKNLTPFLSSIEDKCITATNLYSQGPYTEAGTKGLLCCCDTLDNGGYFCRYDSQEKFITDFFKEVGYETYNINPPTYLLSKRTIDNIDHMLYTSGLDCRFLWSQRFDFYYDKWEKGDFNQDDYEYLKKFVQLVFETADCFFGEENTEEKYLIIKEYIDKDIIRTNREILKREHNKFASYPNAYMDSIFEKKMKHPIFAVKNINLSSMIKTDTVRKVLGNHKHFENRLKEIQFCRNLKNNSCSKGAYKRVISNIFSKHRLNRKIFGEFINRVRNLISGREFDVYRSGLYYTNDPYKLAPSAKTQFDYAASIIEQSDKNNRFILVHPEEPHYFNTFFSYDVADENLMSREFDDAEAYLNTIDSSYRGSIFYDLSIKYIDKQIECLYKRLENSGKLNDTLVVVTADHGSSYFFDPIRQILVNNMHSENYHVPLYIFGNGVSGHKYKKMCTSKDVIPTIADVSSVKLKGDIKGVSLLDKSNRSDWIMIEFMGPGCPDIRLKPVWLQARSLEYAVSYIGRLKDPFDEKNIKEIYNLIDDPLEEVNIYKLRNEKINTLIKYINSRFQELRSEQFLN